MKTATQRERERHLVAFLIGTQTNDGDKIKTVIAGT